MLCVGGGLSTVRGCGCGHPFLQARGCRGVAPGDDGCWGAERWWFLGERVGWRVRFRLGYSHWRCWKWWCRCCLCRCHSAPVGRRGLQCVPEGRGGGWAGLLGRWVVVRVHVGVVALVVVPAIGLRALLWLKRLVPQARLGGASLELWLVCIHPVG